MSKMVSSDGTKKPGHQPSPKAADSEVVQSAEINPEDNSSLVLLAEAASLISAGTLPLSELDKASQTVQLNPNETQSTSRKDVADGVALTTSKSKRSKKSSASTVGKPVVETARKMKPCKTETTTASIKAETPETSEIKAVAEASTKISTDEGKSLV